LEKGSANDICGTDEGGWKESFAELGELLSVAAPCEVVSWDGEPSGQDEMRGPSMPSWIRGERAWFLSDFSRWVKPLEQPGMAGVVSDTGFYYAEERGK